MKEMYLGRKDYYSKSIGQALKIQIFANTKDEILTYDTWLTYGEPIGSYEKSFSSALGDKKIIDLIKDKAFPVAIDLMAPSDTLASLFKKIPLKPKLGVALSYRDRRNISKLGRDAVLGVKQVTGDILDSLTWDKIEKALNGKKADLIMERAYGGKDCITRSIKVHYMLLNKAYKLLNENGGVLLVDTPYYSDWFTLDGEKKRYSDWISLARNQGIDVSMHMLGCIGSNFFKIIKNPESPQNLPFLK